MIQPYVADDGCIVIRATSDHGNELTVTVQEWRMFQIAMYHGEYDYTLLERLPH